MKKTLRELNAELVSQQVGSTVDVERDYMRIHQESLKKAIEGVVRPMVDAGGTPIDVMVFTNSVLLGVAAWLSEHLPGGSDLMTPADVVGMIYAGTLEMAADLAADHHPIGDLINAYAKDAH